MSEVIVTNSCHISNQIFTDWNNPNEDGLRIDGKAGGVYVEVRDCIFERTNLDSTQADELASVISGAKAVFHWCVFRDSGKGVLIGKGSENETDKDTIEVEFDHCVFENLSRRCPYVNAGKVVMRNCTIKNWGRDKYFYLKSAGVRAGSHADITLINCHFEQDSFWTCLTRRNAWRDLFNQYLFPFLGFGFMRGAYAEKGGKVRFQNCTKNRWWIILKSSD